MDGAALRAAVETVASFVAAFRPETFHGVDAATLVSLFARLERLASAGAALAAQRAEATNAWRDQGYASPAEWLASRTRTPLSTAHETLATANRLEACPGTEAAWRRGELSSTQAALVSSAVAVDPDAERRLLVDARRGTHRQLRDAVRATKAAATAGQAVDLAAIHRTRYLRHWIADDGALEGRFRLTPHAGARVLAALEAAHRTEFERHRRAGDRDPAEAIQADALCALADGALGPPAGEDGPTGPTAIVRVRVDHAALVRGQVAAGEVCEIEGIGPVPIEVVRRAASDAVLRAVLVDGDRVIDVRHAGRTIPARLRRALRERDRCWVVPGCGRSRRLEFHHLDPYALGGVASMANLARICAFHHDLITYEGARLTGTHPTFEWHPPGDLRTAEALDASNPAGPDGEDAPLRPTTPDTDRPDPAPGGAGP